MTMNPAEPTDITSSEAPAKKKKSMLISWIYVTLSLIAASSVLYILFREMLKEISWQPPATGICLGEPLLRHEQT